MDIGHERKALVSHYLFPKSIVCIIETDILSLVACPLRQPFELVRLISEEVETAHLLSTPSRGDWTKHENRNSTSATPPTPSRVLQTPCRKLKKYVLRRL